MPTSFMVGHCKHKANALHISKFRLSLAFFIDWLNRRLFKDAFQLYALFHVPYFLNCQEDIWKALEEVIEIRFKQYM